MVKQTPSGWRLEIPAGAAGAYRLAQLDDYANLLRSNFPSANPVIFSLRCRASDKALSGTWGFGLWNDPFAFSLGLQGMPQRLPALPNACWFFHASAENHLAFQNNLPGSGFLAQSFRSPKIPTALLATGTMALPLLFSRTISAWMRKIAGKIIREDSRLLKLDVTNWHTYIITWQARRVIFEVDGLAVLETPVSPQGPLGVVIWIDNQYAAWRPGGEVSMGTLAQNEASWVEIEQIKTARSLEQTKAHTPGPTGQ
jgi:hypothetical protein